MYKKINIVITGATSGIGFQTCKLLSSQEFNIIGTGSTKISCLDARKKFKRDNIKFFDCDLSDHNSIKLLSQKIESEFQTIDILVNNAGKLFIKPELDPKGIEKTFSVNYLGHYLLTRLLLKKILTSNCPRIINVSSVAHKRGILDLSQLNNTNLTAFQAYSRSKLSQILFMKILSKKLESSNITISSLHPGLIGTNLLSKNGFWGKLLTLGHKLVGKSTDSGAKNVLYNIKSENTHNMYFSNSKNEKLSNYANDINLANELWDISAKLCGLSTKLEI
ncbi:MAG: SDR family NAD(P)-dependent oxidoreductase [SAR202 cluster bacterium]|nr:SDR family NAD(P)-dependent oxidoreductase [SAR202 cluster bacterium]|tara:strand:+ start:18044 stop:18877 length:834 start_codon:yes stop_codon:yes gene_type:complete